MDIFEIEAVDLRAVQKLVLGQFSPGDGKGWYLEKTILKIPMSIEEIKKQNENTNNSNNKIKTEYKEYELPCKRYL